MPTTESKLLTDKEIAEIERDLESSPLATFPMTTEQVRAFCATVKHLRAENEALKRTADIRYNQVTELRDQLAEARQAAEKWHHERY